MSAIIYIPKDAAARSVGADRVAKAVAAEAAARGMDVTIVRTGSRGMLWLEPLVEVATPAGRVAYGPVKVSDVAGLFEAGLVSGGTHRLGHGLTEKIPFFKAQTRLTFANVGRIDPTSVAEYRAEGGFVGLAKALAISGAEIVKEVLDSGLRGRGGAGFPAGIKWKTVQTAVADEKFVACNADEGDSGTFADRMLMEGDPFLLIEGMAIAGLAVGAENGYVYIRSEYPDAIVTMREAVVNGTAAGWLGHNIQGSGRHFFVHVREGAGSYVCGEETAMLESLEGKRGMVRAKPPLPALVGLFGKPTVVNNVLTLAAVPTVLAHGAKAYQDLGYARSRGTQPFQLAGNIKFGGLFEAPFGITLRDLVETWGGGTRSGRPIKAVQVGGPLGGWVPPTDLDAPADYEALAAIGALLGHGGVVVADDRLNMADEAREALAFCATESCGKCTPCRIGSTRGVEMLDKLKAGTVTLPATLALLEDLCEVMADGSLCALGGLTPLPVRSAVRHFPNDFMPVTVGA